MQRHAAETALLSELIDDKAKAPFVEPYHAVVLKESGVGARLKKVTIQHLDADALVLLPEKGQTTDRRYTPMFGFPAGWTHHKACDAILFIQWKKRDYIVFIELKSNSPKGCEQQIKCAEHFVDYIFSVLKFQKRHARHDRIVRRVVFNTAKTICQTINKSPINPRTPVAQHVVWQKVANNAVLSPADFC